MNIELDSLWTHLKAISLSLQHKWTLTSDVYLIQIFYVSFPDPSLPPEPRSSALVRCRLLRHLENVLLLKTRKAMVGNLKTNLNSFKRNVRGKTEFWPPRHISKSEQKLFHIHSNKILPSPLGCMIMTFWAGLYLNIFSFALPEVIMFFITSIDELFSKILIICWNIMPFLIRCTESMCLRHWNAAKQTLYVNKLLPWASNWSWTMCSVLPVLSLLLRTSRFFGRNAFFGTTQQKY